ncbi:unnamed protein product, partial [Aphanomyces euteiches]
KIIIGNFNRFITLVGLSIGTTIICYVYERLRHPSLPKISQNSFLSPSALYLFSYSGWKSGN